MGIRKSKCHAQKRIARWRADVLRTGLSWGKHDIFIVWEKMTKHLDSSVLAPSLSRYQLYPPDTAVRFALATCRSLDLFSDANGRWQPEMTTCRVTVDMPAISKCPSHACNDLAGRFKVYSAACLLVRSLFFFTRVMCDANFGLLKLSR